MTEEQPAPGGMQGPWRRFPRPRAAADFDLTDFEYSGGVNVFGAALTLGDGSLWPSVVFSFARADGSGFLRPISLVAKPGGGERREVVSDRCRSCGAEVLWAKTVPGDKSTPLNAAEVPAGTPGAMVVVYGASDRAFAYSRDELAERIAIERGFSLERAHAVIAADYPWHTSHFATCPNADKHRRSR
jgi:hypothetical protein